LPDERNPIDAWKQAIDCHHGISAGTTTLQSVVAIDGEIYLIAARRKRVHDLPGRLPVVLDDENAAPPGWHACQLQITAQIDSI
jgi:hypothetical protein